MAKLTVHHALVPNHQISFDILFFMSVYILRRCECPLKHKKNTSATLQYHFSEKYLKVF
jgi:hypothetical protein